jgi:hypothetical protein
VLRVYEKENWFKSHFHEFSVTEILATPPFFHVAAEDNYRQDRVTVGIPLLSNPRRILRLRVGYPVIPVCQSRGEARRPW